MSGPGTGWRTTIEAEHALLSTGEHIDSACTHFAASVSAVLVTVEAGGVVHVLGAAGSGTHDADVERVRALHTGRRGGRLFVFPGCADLVGRMTVGQLRGASAVDEVVMIGQRQLVPGDQVIDTQGYVRPELADGVVRLLVRPAAGGLVIPFEQASPTPCCADHGPGPTSLRGRRARRPRRWSGRRPRRRPPAVRRTTG
ncbi:MAG: hypothetical protein ABIV05_07505, partial [Actinomycetota bacterium]